MRFKRTRSSFLLLEPLILLTGQSITDIDKEIVFVCEMIIKLAEIYLPTCKERKTDKSRIHSPELSKLCKDSKETWKAWNAYGRPTSGPIYEAKRDAKKEVRTCINKLRAISTRREIQHRDLMFRTNNNKRFKVSNGSRNDCNRLLTEAGVVTDPQAIALEFSKYFEGVLSSRVHVDSNQSEVILASALHNSYTMGITHDVLSEPVGPLEVLSAIKALKSGKASGLDGLLSEHLKHGGPTLIPWLTKILNRIFVTEEIPLCLKKGLIVPVYKRKGKDPSLASSYRGITISPIISKLLEIIILKRIEPLLEGLNMPDCLQTAYRKGLSCSDAVFTTQEALLTYLREGGHSYLCLFDLENAFDSIEHCVLLEKLLQMGIGGKTWRVIRNCYVSATSVVRVGSVFSDIVPISRGVKQGSVLSPLLFLITVDTLLKELRSQNAGLSVLGTFVGGAAHADDLRTIATTKNTIATQVNIIDNFTSKHSLRLNQAKTEIVKITLQPNQFEEVAINHLNTITTLPAAKCLGVWWSHNLSALRSVQENIIKARKAFFAFGSIQAFQGNLNPLSAISVFESCVLPILLYGCETWLLDSSTIQLLERFQLEIGRRILKLPKWFSGTVIRICLSLPSIVYRIFLRKIKYLSKLLVGDSKSISSRVFVSATIADPVDVSLIQQCKMLESIIGVTFTCKLNVYTHLMTLLL